MSPEQVSADVAVDARTDQYSLALVLYECLAGSPAFSGINAQATAALRLKSQPTPLGVARPELPRFVIKAIERALQRERDLRFPSISDFNAALGHGGATRGNRNPRAFSSE
jgi:serine/threonine-protein kinase